MHSVCLPLHMMYPPVPLLLLVPVFVPAAAAAVAAAINTILCRRCWQGWRPREPRQLLVSNTPPTLLGTLFIVTVPVTTPAHTSRAMPSVINCSCLIAGLEIGLPKVWRARREAASRHALHRHYRLHGACTHEDDDAAALQPIMPPSGPWLLAPVTGQQDHAHSGDATTRPCLSSSAPSQRSKCFPHPDMGPKVYCRRDNHGGWMQSPSCQLRANTHVKK